VLDKLSYLHYIGSTSLPRKAENQEEEEEIFVFNRHSRNMITSIV